MTTDRIDLTTCTAVAAYLASEFSPSALKQIKEHADYASRVLISRARECQSIVEAQNLLSDRHDFLTLSSTIQRMLEMIETDKATR